MKLFKLGFGLGLNGHFAEIAHGVAGGLGIVTVTEATRLCLTDSFQR